MMLHGYKILYKTAKGLMAYDGGYIIFVNSRIADKCTEGVALLDETSLALKGTYAFADFKNVKTVIPNNYDTLSFFANTGVPNKIYKGTYGDCVFVKEIYINGRTIIKGFLKNDECVIFESEYKAHKHVLNPFYTRLNNAITDWVDITEVVVNKVLTDLKGISTEVDFNSTDVFNILERKLNRPIYKSDNGVILVDGKYETLILWDVEGVLKLCWAGRKLDYAEYSCTNVNSELMAKWGIEQ